MSLERKKLFGRMEGTTAIGSLTFPNRIDYERYFFLQESVGEPSDVWEDDSLVGQIQQHWHSRGQNGCVFAQTVASKADRLGWNFVIVRGLSEVKKDLLQAIESPECQNLSLLFPEVTQPNQLVDLVQSIIKIDDLFRLQVTNHMDTAILALRIKLIPTEVLSWIVGFGPFDFLPYTRQAPVTELAIRTKLKPKKLFWRLNSDQAAAHLEDVPVGLNDHQMEKLWQATYLRTRQILGSSPRAFSSAKVTFAIPMALWEPL